MATVLQRLQTLGLDPSFSGRQSLYNQYGLGGNFTGTAQQNLTLASEAEKRKASPQSSPTALATPAPAAPPPSPSAAPPASSGEPAPLSYDQINAQLQPMLNAYGAQSQAQGQLIGNQYQDLSNRLRENAGYAQESMLNNQNNLGLLQSGQTGQQGAYLQRDLSNQLNRADIQRTMDQADLALQQANFGFQTGSQLGSLGQAQQGLQQGQQRLQQGQQELGFGQAKGLTDLYSNPFILSSLPDSVRQHVFGQYGINYTQ